MQGNFCQVLSIAFGTAKLPKMHSVETKTIALEYSGLLARVPGNSPGTTQSQRDSARPLRALNTHELVARIEPGRSSVSIGWPAALRLILSPVALTLSSPQLRLPRRDQLGSGLASPTFQLRLGQS
jgi:hypothetical protein